MSSYSSRRSCLSFEQVLARNLEMLVPADWLWHGRHVNLVDGTRWRVPEAMTW